MKKLLIIIFTTFEFLNCNKKSKVEINKNFEDVKSSYSEELKSKFEIISTNNKHGYTYKSIESNFKVVSIQLEKFDNNEYFANIITNTIKSTGDEGQERNIKVSIKSFDNPTKPIIEINKDCDNIELLHNTYKTTKYGCCGSEKFCEIYNYKNKQIIAGKGKIITGFIPNSSLTIYASFTQNLLDSTDFGTIHYSTTTGNKFDIKLKSNRKRNAACDINAEIAIQTNNKIDKFDVNENSYTLWSLDKIENENDIENLTIQIQLQSIDKCIGKMDTVPLKIPIIHGKPFGKDIKIQEMIIQ